MSDFKKIIERERGLQPQLTAKQMSMIAIGGAIGTGLFMGSAIAMQMAGPGILISYAIGAVIALLLMGCLAEMTVTHPTSGSFGAYAEHYISPLAGFLVRYTYWSCIVLAVGTEVTAMGKYMAYWFQNVPAWVWVLLFSALLISINTMSVKAFGIIEYLFSMIKITAIVLFILIGAYVVFGIRPEGVSFANYHAHNGFLPYGMWGAWSAVIVALFSYLSIEMIAVAAGEAQNPEKAITSAFRSTMVRLVVFYLLTLILMLAIVPWNHTNSDKSPFVLVMEMIGLPGAAGIINFVILIAALSAMNSQLYTSTRMMFSLSRAGFAPQLFGRLSFSGVPVPALALSCSGVAVAVLLNYFAPENAFQLMMAISVFGALFTWLMIFITHLFFRIKRKKENQPAPAFRMRGFPFTTLLGACLMFAAMVTTCFNDIFRLTLVTGLPFLLFLTLAYYVWYKKQAAKRQFPAIEAA